MDNSSLNMLPYHDEYKIMGLAPYADNTINHQLYKKFQKFFLFK